MKRLSLFLSLAVAGCSPTEPLPETPAELFFLSRDARIGAKYEIWSWTATAGASKVSSPAIDSLGIVGGPSVSWDGSQVAFSTARRVYIMNRDGTNLHSVPAPTGALTLLAWSPDGTRIAVEGNRAVVPSDSTASPRLFQGDTISVESPSFAPDGRLVFASSYYTPGHGTFPDSTTLYIVSADGARLTRLFTTNIVGSVAWSPRGDLIAFALPVSSSPGIYIIRPDGSDLKRLYGGASLLPAWSPDGRSLSFKCTVDIPGPTTPKSTDICVGDVAGTPATNVTTNPTKEDYRSAWGIIPR
jgi:Tol biopolymer transport system component